LLAEVLLFSLVANTSISSLNLSLLVNSVGTYQVCVCLWVYGAAAGTTQQHTDTGTAASAGKGC
jgi:hypothetical protein